MLEKIKEINGTMRVEEELTLEEAQQLNKEIFKLYNYRWYDFGYMIENIIYKTEKFGENVFSPRVREEIVNIFDDLLYKYKKLEEKQDLSLFEQIQFSVRFDKEMDWYNIEESGILTY